MKKLLSKPSDKYFTYDKVLLYATESNTGVGTVPVPLPGTGPGDGVVLGTVG